MISTFLRALRAARALNRVRRLLGEVYKPQGVIIWLCASNRRLAHHSPIELILHDCAGPVLAEAERLAAS